MFESIIQKFVSYMLIFLIFIYHFITLLMPEILDKNLSSMINIIEWSMLIFFALITFKLTLVHRLLLGKDYIGGKYLGESYYLDDKNNIDDSNSGRDMEFEIIQTLAKIEIIGTSLSTDKSKADTTWKGYFYKKDGNTYFFALEVDIGTREVGIFELVFNENSRKNFSGYYYSGSNNSKVQKVVFKKDSND